MGRTPRSSASRAASASRWLRRLDRPSEGPTSSQVEALCSAIAFTSRRSPENRELPGWVAQARQWLELPISRALLLRIGCCLVRHYERVGDAIAMGTVVRLLDSVTSADELGEPALDAARAIHAWHVADWDACDRAGERASSLGTEVDVGVRVALIGAGIARHVTAGTMTDANAGLARLRAALEPDRRPQRGLYHYLAAWVALVGGGLEEAREHAAAGTALSRASGERWLDDRLVLAQAQIDLAAGTAGPADLGAAQSRVERSEDSGLELQWLCAQADAALGHGHGGADEAVREALALGRRLGRIVFPYWRRDVMQRLCRVAAASDIETDYVRRLAGRHGIDLGW